MIEAYVRPIYQRVFVDPIAIWIQNNCPIKAEIITYLGAFFGFLTIPFLWAGAIKLSIVCLLISGYLDTLDGTIARLSFTTSNVGAVIDIMADRFVEFSIIMGLFLVDREARSGMCLMMLGSILICVTSFLLVGIFSEKDTEKTFHYSPGLIERPEAFAFFIAMILLPEYFALIGGLFALLTFATAVSRVSKFISQTEEA